MFDSFRENLRNTRRKTPLILLIPVLITTVYLVLVVRWNIERNDGYVGALLDDTWIHVRFADHLAQGKGLAYNEGVVTPGATSPLWVLALAAIYKVTNPDITQQVHAAVILSAVGAVLTSLAITGFGWWVTRRAWLGLLAGTVTALTGRLIWMGLSGMEITTFTALCIVALWSHVDDVRSGRVFGWRTGICAALATLGRPEGYLLSALLMLDAFALVPVSEGRFDWRQLRSGWRGVVAYVLLAGTYPLFSLIVAGHPLPNTFRVKSQFGKEFPQLPYAYFWEPNVDHGVLFSALMVIGTLVLLRQARRERTGFAWGLWHPAFVLAVLFLGAQHYVVNNSRYVAPAIPFHALAAAVGVGWAAKWIAVHVSATPHPPSPSPKTGEQNPSQWFLKFPPHLLERGFRSEVWIVSTLSLLLIFLAFWLGREQGPRVASDTAQLRKMHVAAGEWVRSVTQRGQTIALNDVGAIVHIADRPVLDMVGLVSPEVLDAIKDEERFSCPHDLALARLMLDNPPAFIGIFPWFFPCLTSRWADALQPYNVFAITGTTVIAGGEMVFYWPLWENWPLQREIPADSVQVSAAYEQGITLAAYQSVPVNGGLQVTLWWTANAQPEGDYTVFVHLIDAEGNILAQKDSPPQDGRFNTLWWRPGDIIPERRLIPFNNPALLERDDLALRIGLYETGGTTRLLHIAAPIGEEEFAIVPLTIR